MTTKPDKDCNECGGTGNVMGYGYGSDGAGGIRQYKRIMACHKCTSSVSFNSEHFGLNRKARRAQKRGKS